MDSFKILYTPQKLKVHGRGPTSIVTARRVGCLPDSHIKTWLQLRTKRRYDMASYYTVTNQKSGLQMTS